jgi:hypothetical protein
MGPKVAPILFKNVKIDGVVVRSEQQLKRDGYEFSAPVAFKFAP